MLNRAERNKTKLFIAEGQRIESFQIRRTPDTSWASFSGLTVGARKICKLNANHTDKLYLRVSARDEIDLKHVKIYAKSKDEVTSDKLF